MRQQLLRGSRLKQNNKIITVWINKQAQDWQFVQQNTVRQGKKKTCTKYSEAIQQNILKNIDLW